MTPGYRVRLSLERAEDVEHGAWTEIDAEVLFIYDDVPGIFSTVDASKAARMAFAGILQEREDRTLRGGKGVV